MKSKDYTVKVHRQVNGVDYTRQIITIAVPVYNQLRETAQRNYARKLNIGDVIQAYMDATKSNEDASKKFNTLIDQAREAARPPTKKEIMNELKSLTPEERRKLFDSLSED